MTKYFTLNDKIYIFDDFCFYADAEELEKAAENTEKPQEIVENYIWKCGDDVLNLIQAFEPYEIALREYRIIARQTADMCEDEGYPKYGKEFDRRMEGEYERIDRVIKNFIENPENGLEL